MKRKGTKESQVRVPTPAEFQRCVKARRSHQKRDAMYTVATFLVRYFWRDPSKMTEGLGVLLLTWNQAFYRYGYLDFDKLENCISENLETIKNFRSRKIFSLKDSDKEVIKTLFVAFLGALKIKTKKNRKEKVTPVGVAKALHLLAPEFFPLWDNKIAQKYHCSFNRNNAPRKYVDFCRAIRDVAGEVKSYQNLPKDSRTLVKLIDEYNYSKYTKNWC